MSVAAEIDVPAPALEPRGPAIVLGGADPFSPDIRPTPGALFGPRSAFLAGSDGPLLIADTGHHRVVVHHRLPKEDGREADLVLGQPDFHTEGRNALRDEPTAETMNVPTGICRFGEGLAVADSWNNRVLVWRNMPVHSSQPADFVLGQGDFEHQRPNRDGEPRADTMHWPFQVMVHGGRLYVCDAGNRRVLVWRDLPGETGQPADFALGQADLESRSDNGGKSADARSVRWPHDMTIHGGRLLVSDAGNNRVLAWNELPNESNVPASLVLGQADFTGTDHNRGIYLPTAESFSMPYALQSGGDRLLVADTANSRLLGFTGPIRSGRAADLLTAQPDFRSKGDNRNKLPVRDSLCWPYGLHCVEDLAIVSDTGNHRVLLWSLADAI
ncbi:MAG: hypothetical protein AAGD10_14630 [Myxococcota bacterium]